MGEVLAEATVLDSKRILVVQDRMEQIVVVELCVVVAAITMAKDIALVLNRELTFDGGS